MRPQVKVRFREDDSTLAEVMADAAGPGARVGGRSTLEVVPAMSPRDEAIFLLHTAAEIEHALMVQYLYAAWSLPPQAPTAVQRWRRDILQVAREEMAHFASVQNLLRFLGGPLNFDREDFPFRSDFYPFPLRLEPLGRASLARYIAAEMPAEPDIDPGLLTTVNALAAGADNGQPVNRVGALYNRLTTLLADQHRLPDSLLRPDTAASIQAPPARYRADAGQGPLFLRVVASRDQALSLLNDIASQGEGEDSILDSHFLTFVEIFDNWPAERGAHSLQVPTDANTTPSGVERDDADLSTGRITHPHTRTWAWIFNHHYRMLLAWLQHALLTPANAAASAGLSLRVFAEMLVLSDVGQLLTTLPRTAEGMGRAGATFELPYSLAFPDLPADRWDYQRDLVSSARAQLDALDASTSPTEDAVRQHLLGSIKAAERLLATATQPPPTEDPR